VILHRRWPNLSVACCSNGVRACTAQHRKLALRAPRTSAHQAGTHRERHTLANNSENKQRKKHAANNCHLALIYTPLHKQAALLIVWKPPYACALCWASPAVGLCTSRGCLVVTGCAACGSRQLVHSWACFACNWALVLLAVLGLAVGSLPSVCLQVMLRASVTPAQGHHVGLGGLGHTLVYV
jgi:hypothetical protein